MPEMWRHRMASVLIAGAGTGIDKVCEKRFSRQRLSLRRLPGLITRDLFLELVDRSLQGFHRHFAELFVPAGLALQGGVTRFQPSKLGLCVGEFSIISQA